MTVRLGFSQIDLRKLLTITEHIPWVFLVFFYVFSMILILISQCMVFYVGYDLALPPAAEKSSSLLATEMQVKIIENPSKAPEKSKLTVIRLG